MRYSLGGFYFQRHAFIVLVSLFYLLPLGCRPSFAENKRAPEGSVEFGAKTNPAQGISDKVPGFKSIFADVAEKILPTVVSVIPTKIDTVLFYKNPFYFGNPFGDEDPFQWFFGEPQQPQRGKRRNQEQQPQVEKQFRRQQGLGSGVIVSSEGYILTNYHVVAGANEIQVKLYDGREFEAQIIGSDSLADVATLKLKTKVENLPVAYFGNSDKLRAGDWAIAVGNPFSLTSTVTTGIVSAMGRSVSGGGSAYQNFIQTDAAINPGNSGGALVNIDGELIGINTMIFSSSGGFMGIGFAIPINMARRIMEDLIYKGEVIRGWIGVGIQDIDPATREALEIGSSKGVLINSISKGQPADKAGIKSGDIVLSINGKDVSSANELRNAVAVLQPESKASFVVLRQGKKIDISVTIGKRDEKSLNAFLNRNEDKTAKTDEKTQKKLGITVANITGEMREKYQLRENASGVIVIELDAGKLGDQVNLKEGDLIQQIKVKGKTFITISNAKEFEAATSDIKEGDSVMLFVERNGQSFYTAFKVRK